MLYGGVLFLFVLQFLRPQEFIDIIRGWPVVFWTMVFLLPPWLVTLQWKKLLRTPEDLFVFLLWIVGILSWWTYWKSHMYEPALDFGRTLIIYLLVAHVIDSKRKLVGALWLTMILLAIVGLMAGQDVGLTGQYASIGMFNNRNDFAYAMAILLPLAAAFFLKGTPLAKLFGLGAMVVGVAEVIASESRGGQLAAIFATGAVLYMLVRSKAGKTVALVAGSLGIVAALSMGNRIATVTEYQQDKSAMGRVEIWADCLSRFQDHPIFGHGMGVWNALPKTPRDTHSSYMRALIELGVVGLAVFLGLMFFCLRDVHRVARGSTDAAARLAAIGLFGTIVGQIVGSLFQTRLYHPFIFVQYALVSALRMIHERDLAALEDLGETMPPNETGVRPAERWRASLGAGLRVPRLITRKNVWQLVGLTFGCWLLHKVFCIVSF